MPPGEQVPKAKRALIQKWIAEGAAWPESMVLTKAAKGATDEMATVRALHQRIVAKAAGKAEAYKETIPGTDAAFEMVPIPAGEFLMGSAKGKTDEAPQHKVKLDAFWMGKYEVTWDEYRPFMFAQAAEKEAKDRVVDAVSRPTRPYVEMSFGMGLNAFPAISMTQHAAN